MASRTNYSINKKHPAYVYAMQVIEGKVPACRKEIQACKRHIRDLERQATHGFPYVFDESRAERIYHYFSVCKHEKSVFSGDYIQMLPYQKFDFGVMFGWVDIDTGVRRFTKAIDLIGRGNAKSTTCSVVSLYGLTSDCCYPPGRPEEKRWEGSPFVECMAVDKGQAKIVSEAAMEIAKISPEVLKRVDVKKTYIRGLARGGYIRALSKEVNNKVGGSPSMVIVDEYAAYKDNERVTNVYGGFGKSLQSIMIIISTMGDDAANNPCKAEYDYAAEILSGEKTDESYFAMIRELDKDDNPHDEKLWAKPNPMLRYANAYSKSLRNQIKKEHNEAYGKNDASMIRKFLTMRMNTWQATSEQKYLNSRELEKLDKLAISPEEFDKLIHGRKTICGVDASKKVDLTADGFVYNLPNNKIGIDARGFIPSEAVIRHEHGDRVPYREWISKGYVIEIDGEVIDMVKVSDHITDYENNHQLSIEELCLDPAFCYQFGVDMTEGRNQYRKKYEVVEVPQSYAQLNEPTEMLKNLILEGRLVWNGNPCLRWCFENAYLLKDGGERMRPSKKHKDDSQRIDLLAAVITALRRFTTLKTESLKNQLESGEFSF